MFPISFQLMPFVEDNHFNILPVLPVNFSKIELIFVQIAVSPITEPAIVGGVVETGNVAKRLAQLFCSLTFIESKSEPVLIPTLTDKIFVVSVGG